MLKNLFVITVRNIIKNPIFSFINILGLTLGIATFLFFDQYVNFESSYDDFHDKSESIYRISTLRYSNGELFYKNIGAMPPLKSLLLDQLDGVVILC
jgi:putative ABC transport system permease protein